MADIQSNIRVNLDTSNALESLKNLQRQVSAFQKQMQASSAANAATAQDLQRSLIGDINATGKFAARMQTIKSTTESFTSALEKNKLSMGEYFRYALSGSKNFGKNFSSEFNTIEKVARERVKTLQTQYVSLGRDATGALNAISVRPLTLDLNNLATQQAINAQKQQIFNQLLKQGSTNLLNFGKNTQWAGRQLMVGFTIPLSVFGSTAAKAFMELDEQAIKFKRVYGDMLTPTAEADAMIEQVKALGEEFTKYGVAVKDTMGLAAEAAAMGKQGADLTAQVTEATRLAVLGNVDQSQALETSISLTNAFGVATSQLAGKIDFLNAVENQTVTSISDLTEAIPKAGPVVQQLGGTVEDLAFFLTAMKEGGINASEGANALKSGLASLINPTQKAADMLKIYGVNIREIVSKNAGDVKGTVVDFAKALDQLDPLTRARAIEQLFGKFQFARISTLFQNVIAEGSQASKVLELMGATTSDLAALSSKELKTVEESITYKFKGAIEEFKAQLAPVGEQFMKLVTPLIEFGSKVLETFNNMGDHAKGFITGTIAVLGGLAPVALMTFGLVANGVANLVKGFQFLRNMFMGVSNSEQVLGEQTSYLTEEQLKAQAVAASLEQTHSRLPQIFTVEAGAVDLLAAAYERADSVAQRFANRPIPTSIGKAPGVQKFAQGGFVSGAGTGTSDSIAALVSNGEAIIPADKAKKYAPLIAGIIAGKIPGFAQGTTSVGGKNYPTRGGSESAIGAFVAQLEAADHKMSTITDMLDKVVSANGKLTKKAVAAAAEAEGLKTRSQTSSDRVRMHLTDRTTAGYEGSGRVGLSGLTRHSEKTLNDAIKGTMPFADFISEWNKTKAGTGLKAAATVGMKRTGELGRGQSLSNEEVQVLADLDNAIRDLTVEKAKASGATGINETKHLVPAVKEIIDKAANDQGVKGKVAKALQERMNTVVAERSVIDTEAVKKGYAAGSVVQKGTGTALVNKDTGKEVGRISSELQKALNDATTLEQKIKIINGASFKSSTKPIPGQGSYTAYLDMAENADGITADAMNKRSQAASPAKKTIKAAENLVDGAVVGIEQGKDDVQNAMETTVSQAAGTASRKRGRRGTSAGVTTVGSTSLTYVKDTNSGNVVSSEKMAQLQAGRDAALNKATGMVVSSLSGFAQKAMMVSGAIGGVAMAAEMAGVNLGGFGDAIFTITNSVFAFSSILELLSKGSMMSTMIKGGLAARQGVKAAGGWMASGGTVPTKLLGEGGKLGNIFKNLGGVVSKVLPALEGFGGTLLKFVPVIGWVATAFAVFQIVSTVMEEQRKKIEGLGEAAYLSSEKMKAAGDLLGFTAKTADFSGAFAGTTAGTNSDQQSKITELRANDQFKGADGFGTQIEAVKNATAEQAQLSLQSMSIQLAASGAPKEAVDTLIKAIAAEAGRTDLNLDFTKVDISTAEGQAQIASVATTAANSYMETFDAEISKPRRGSRFGNALTNSTLELQKSANQTAGVYSTLFQSLKSGFESGQISAEQFNGQMANITTNLDKIDPKALAMIVPTIAKNLGLTDQLKGVTDFKDQLMFIKAATAGVNPTKMQKTADAIKKASETGDAKDIRAAATARVELNAEIQRSTEVRQAETEAIQRNADIEAAMTSADEKMTNLRNQIDAYKTLTQQGFSTAEAQALAGDAMWATAIAAAKAQDAIEHTDTNLKAVLDKMREMKKLEGTANKLGLGTGGTTAEKTPLQKAMDQLKEQRTEISQANTAYAKLTKAGVATGVAFAAAQDKILAAAIATTKVGTDKWKKLVVAIKAASAAAQNSALLQFTKENNVGANLTSGFAKITPMLSKLGLTLDDMQNILSNKDMAQAFVNDLKDGVINSKLVKDAIDSIPNQKRVQILFNMSTPQGMEEEFNKIYDQAMAKLDAQESRVEANFRAQERSAQASVDSAQANVDSIQKSIDAIQAKVDAKQKDIELTIDRPIEELNKQVANLERSIELNYNRPIAALQEESGALSHDLDLINKKESEINKKYDDQKKKLQEVAQINKDILDGDKSRLSIAQALTSGNAAAAAQAMQEAQQQEAAKAAERAAAAVDAAKQNEIDSLRSASGMSKAQIEERQFAIGQKVYALEQSKKAVEAQILGIQDQIYSIELKREPLLRQIRTLEDDMYTIQVNQLKPAQDAVDTANNALTAIQNQKQASLDAIQAERDKWNDAKLRIDEAKTKAFDLETQYKAALKIVEDIEKAWANVGTATTNSMSNITGGTSTGGSTGGSNSGGSGAKADSAAMKADKTKSASLQKQISTLQGQAKAANTAISGLQQTLKTLAGASYGQSSIPGLKSQLAGKQEEARYIGQSISMLSNQKAALDKKIAAGGYATGGLVFKNMNTDTVPAMLTPGEFVIKRSAVENYGADRLKAINNGTASADSVYNYSINVSVQTGADASKIAEEVLTQIKRIDSQRIRGNRFNG